jgi:hypothetical protein
MIFMRQQNTTTKSTAEMDDNTHPATLFTFTTNILLLAENPRFS